jgi:hypothetical protein
VETTFIALMLVPASIVLLLLKLAKGTTVERLVLHPVAGISALLALPTLWTLAIELQFWVPRPLVSLGWRYPPSLLLRVEAVWICAIFLIGRTRLIPIWLISLLLIAHYSFWGWVIWPEFSVLYHVSPAFCAPVFPASGFAWLLYLARLRRNRGRAAYL